MLVLPQLNCLKYFAYIVGFSSIPQYFKKLNGFGDLCNIINAQQMITLLLLKIKLKECQKNKIKAKNYLLYLSKKNFALDTTGIFNGSINTFIY